MTATRAAILGLLAALVGAGVAHASGLDTCLAECKKARLSDTNRASCRLDCESDAASDPELIRAQIGKANPTRTPVKATRAPTSTATASGGSGCKPACDADRTLSADDRATCKLECDVDPNSPADRTGTPTTTATTPARSGSPLTFQLSGPPASPAAQAGFLDRCYATCQQGPYKLSATDFETCKLDCQTMASVLDVARGWVPNAWAGPATTQPVTAPKVAATTVPTTTVPVTPTPARTTPLPASTRSAVEICGDSLSECNTRCDRVVKKCERGCHGKHVIETDRETCKLTCSTDTEVCQNDCLAANANCVNSRQPRPR